MIRTLLRSDGFAKAKLAVVIKIPEHPFVTIHI